MTTYKAVFEMPATVRVELEVTAEYQQDGLIAAHDLIRQATANAASIVFLQLDNAVNVSFDRLSSTAESLGSPLDASGRYAVKFFESANGEEAPVRSGDSPSFVTAKALAESVLAVDSRYGSATVHDSFGLMVMKAKAPRGGWEVAVTSQGATKEILHSWLDSREAAIKTAKLMFARSDTVLVRIIDFTNREAGARTFKEIR